MDIQISGNLTTILKVARQIVIMLVATRAVLYKGVCKVLQDSQENTCVEVSLFQ